MECFISSSPAVYAPALYIHLAELLARRQEGGFPLGCLVTSEQSEREELVG